MMQQYVLMENCLSCIICIYALAGYKSSDNGIKIVSGQLCI